MTKKLGLRAEILMTLAILLGAALLCAGVVMLRFMESNLLEERLEQLDVSTSLLAQAIVTADGIKTDEVEAAIPYAIGCRSWWLYGKDSSLTVGRSGDTTDRSMEPSIRHKSRLERSPHRDVAFPSILNLFAQSQSRVHYYHPVFTGKRFIGAFELSCSLHDIRLKILRSLKIIVLYTVLYSLVLIGAGFALLQRNIIDPARNLLLATEAVTHGDLNQYMPIDGPLEIVQLAQSYNLMIDNLSQSRQETQDYITTLEETNKHLEQARNEIVKQEKMASVGQLAAGLAHEVGNPLAALIGYLELLKQQLTSHDGYDLVTRSIAEARRIDFLVRELLNFSRPDKSVQTDCIEPAGELRKIIATLTDQGVLNAVTVNDQLPEALPPISINLERYRQIFVNLIINAVHACKEGGQISVSAICHSEAVSLAVSDAGSGIAPAILDKIFEPFFTTKEPGFGTGLGLSVCQRIIEESQGIIQVESVPNEGSRFVVTWPRR